MMTGKLPAIGSNNGVRGLGVQWTTKLDRVHHLRWVKNSINWVPAWCTRPNGLWLPGRRCKQRRPAQRTAPRFSAQGL